MVIVIILFNFFFFNDHQEIKISLFLWNSLFVIIEKIHLYIKEILNLSHLSIKEHSFSLSLSIKIKDGPHGSEYYK